MKGIEFGRIVAKKNGTEQNISKEEIRKKLEEGWYVGVEFHARGKSGWIVIDKNKMDVLALGKDVIDYVRKHEKEILECLGVI
jgi:hypothetical protein